MTMRAGSMNTALPRPLDHAGDWNNRPLDRSSPLPLYAQIKQRLVAMLLTFDWPDGRFFSDEQLCEMFGVSRDTVRQAVSELVQEGLLTRTRGLGTFVSNPKVEERFDAGMDFLRQWADHGTPMQSTLLVFERAGADAAVAAQLEIEVDAPVLFIKRVRSTASVPVALDYRYLPADLTADWTEASAEGSPLHLLWQQVDLKSGDFAIDAGLAGAEEAEYLQLPIGAPVLIRTLRYRDVEGRLAMAGHTVHRADISRYTLTIPLSRDRGVAGINASTVHRD
jgi:GntR family transcriptional regulator